MNEISVHGKIFIPYIPFDKIEERTKSIAKDIENEYKGKNVLFLGILNGAFMFMAELMKHIESPCKISFVKTASYHGMESAGNVTSLIGLNEDLSEYDVIVVEDIIDSGLTIISIMDTVKKMNAKSVATATLLFKKEALKIPFNPNYVGFEIPNRFVLGFGLDYDGLGRNYKDIYQLKP
jgi:hypoxanthine phosphoribosyltransferase